MSGYYYQLHYHHQSNGGSGGVGSGDGMHTPTAGAALDELVCGKSDGNPSSVASNVSPNSMFFSSILFRDLNLSESEDSEDSDVKPGSDDPFLKSEDKVAECQSKKGKVITPSAGVPVKSAVSPMSSSSSSSSSSESSSESDGDDDDDENKEGAKQGGAALHRSSDGSSSSSSSSSEPSDDEDNELDEGKNVADSKKTEDVTDVRTAVERGEKTPSPSDKQGVATSGSKSTPPTLLHENSDTNFIWRLDNFIHPKKNSPASVSPVKSASPPMSHSAPPSVQQKDPAKTPEQSRPRTLKELGHRGTVSFEVQMLKVSEDDDDEDNLADVEDAVDDESQVFEKTKTPVVSPKKDVQLALITKSSEFSKTTDASGEECDKSKKLASNNALLNTNAALADQKCVNQLKKESFRSRSSSAVHSRKDRRKLPSPASNASPSKIKTSPPLREIKRQHSGSSSSDEIDVESVTPEKTRHSLLNSGKTVKADASKSGFSNGTLSGSSEGDVNVPPYGGKNTEVNHIKHHKRKDSFGERPPALSSSMPLLPTNNSLGSSAVTSGGASSKTPKKESAVTMGHLEAIYKPPNLLSPIHATRCSPPVASTKPLPPFQSSFPPMHSSTPAMPPYVTLTLSPNGISQPKLLVQIRHSSISKKVLNWIKEKKERRKKSQKVVKLSESSKSAALADTSKESRMPHLIDSKSSLSFKDGDTSGLVKNREPSSSPKTVSSAHSMSSEASRPGKHKLSDGTLPLADVHRKMPKLSRTSSKEVHSSTQSEASSAKSASKSSSSVSLPATSTLTASQRKTVTSSSPEAVGCGTTDPGKHLDIKGDKDLILDDTKMDKSKILNKRKLDIADECLPKKREPESAVGDKNSSTDPATIGGRRRDSSNSTSSKGSHHSTASKKSRHSSVSRKDINSNNNSIDKVNAHITNGPDKSNLPFNHYINGNSSSSNTKVTVNSHTQSSSVLPATLPPPSPIETELHGTKHYLARAREHKHHADNLKDKLAKYEPYLRSGLSFFLAGYSMEVIKRDAATNHQMYYDTSNLLQFVIRMRANSSSNPDCSDRERKLIVLIIRLQAFLNHRMYRLKKSEASKLRRVIEAEQPKYHSSSTTVAATSSSSNASATTTTTSRPHAPSPHQVNWNKNSTGTPSPMSPTPSPAGSVSSQGSCELVTAKMQNSTTSSSSTPLTSPSPSMVSVHPRVHAFTQKYFFLVNHLVKALELWDQADAESRGFEDFFTILDNACGPLSFHSEPPVVVRYMKHALRLLNL